MNKIYFSQVDSRWKNHSYPSQQLPNATIGSGGCGATSAAMIISSMVQTIYPNQMGDIFRQNGLRVNGGTSTEAFPWIAKEYGLEMKKSIYISDAIECLKRGGMCIAYLKAKSLFADGGHIIVLAGMKDDSTIIVFDPYLYNNKFNIVYKGVDRRNKIILDGTSAYISIDNFKNYNNYTLFCYEAPHKEEPSKYQIGEAVEINIPVGLTTAKAINEQIGGMDLQVDDLQNTPESQYWVHESVVKDSRIIARALVCYTAGKRYMVQVFNRQFWCNEDNIVKKL